MNKDHLHGWLVGRSLRCLSATRGQGVGTSTGAQLRRGLTKVARRGGPS